MTSRTSNLNVSKNLNISKTKQDIEKLKTPLTLVWKCCPYAPKIGSKIFRRSGTINLAFNYSSYLNIFVCNVFLSNYMLFKTLYLL